MLLTASVTCKNASRELNNHDLTERDAQMQDGVKSEIIFSI